MALVPGPDDGSAVRRKGHPILAWLIILGVVGFLAWRRAPGIEPGSEGFDPAVVEMQGRCVVGLADLLHVRGKSLLDAMGAEGGLLAFGQGLRLAVVAGEISGPSQARKELTNLEKASALGKASVPTAEQKRLSRILNELYSHYEDEDWAGGLAEPLRQEVLQQLGWFGELALAPADGPDQDLRQSVLSQAHRAAVGLLAYGVIVLFVGTIGLALAMALLVLLLLGRLHSGIRAGVGAGGIYAETFALYLLSSVGFGLVARILPVGGDAWLPLRSGLAALGTLIVLAWPVLRGIRWRQVRQDIGWTLGRQPALEPLLGAGCYAAAVPMVFVGLVTFTVLTLLARRLGMAPPPPTHPILHWLTRADWLGRLQIVLDACVVAPLVEESMFRGFLYRHLREATAAKGAVRSVILSAVASSFIFAVIHPQGILFVPVLMALALAFALAREWRGTLVPPMIAHAITNGLALMLVLFTLG